MGGMGDEIMGAPGSFSSWNVMDQIAFEQSLEKSRRAREAKLAETVTENVVEIEGENK
jgi:hypothetical protein